MSDRLLRQKRYWDSAVDEFDAIYSHDKGFVGNLLDRLVRWDMYRRFEYTMLNSEPIDGHSFLDVGCGTGRYALEFARRGARMVVGLDISPNMAGVCEERAASLGLKERTRFVVTDLLGYSPTEPADVTIGIGLFDYIKDPVPVLRKMRESARDRVIVTFPTLWTWKAPVRKLNLSARGCDVFFFTRTAVTGYIKAAGFRDFTIEKIGQLYCVTALV
jgi:SAM-dependent methyltransferase